jgi:hypothetical protein
MLYENLREKEIPLKYFDDVNSFDISTLKVQYQLVAPI